MSLSMVRIRRGGGGGEKGSKVSCFLIFIKRQRGGEGEGNCLFCEQKARGKSGTKYAGVGEGDADT